MKAFPALSLLGLAVVGVAVAADPAPSPSGEALTHVLYLGAEFSVEWRKESRPVVDVQGDSLVVDVGGVRTPLRSPASQLPIQMEPTMKLGRDSAEVTVLEATSVFSEDNNPHRGSEQGAAFAQDATLAADLAAFHLRLTERATGLTEVNASTNPAAANLLRSAQEAYSDRLHAQGSTTNSPVGQGAAAGAGRDAFRLSFAVSAPRALIRPYAMIFVRYFEQPDNPKTARVRIYPLPLVRVDEKPRRYHLLRAGLPPGYQLERFALHLFEDGREIATTAATKRVAVTTEEAFQYRLVTHLTEAGAATQDPSPAREFWPSDLADRLGAGNRNRLIFVQVDKEGRVTGAFHDADRKLRIADPDISNVLPHLPFLPALEKGKAVPGFCRVNLGVTPL